jgi:DNA-binding NtrC family response regulator
VGVRKTVIVEDDQAIRQSLADICRLFLDVEPAEAATAREALAILETERPAVVLLDLVLPGEGGEWLLAELVRLGWRDELHVVVMTAQTESERIADQLGADGVLAKPFSLERVTQVLREAGAA